jgi:hypothetical protein
MEIELVRESWGENENKGDRWVDLYVGADGPVRLSHHDLRPSLKGPSAEDYEYHVSVAAAAVPKLVFALLREKYLGRSAVHEFRVFCKRKASNFGTVTCALLPILSSLFLRCRPPWLSRPQSQLSIFWNAYTNAVLTPCWRDRRDFAHSRMSA